MRVIEKLQDLRDATSIQTKGVNPGVGGVTAHRFWDGGSWEDVWSRGNIIVTTCISNNAQGYQMRTLSKVMTFHK